MIKYPSAKLTSLITAQGVGELEFNVDNSCWKDTLNRSEYFAEGFGLNQAEFAIHGGRIRLMDKRRDYLFGERSGFWWRDSD